MLAALTEEDVAFVREYLEELCPDASLGSRERIQRALEALKSRKYCLVREVIKSRERKLRLYALWYALTSRMPEADDWMEEADMCKKIFALLDDLSNPAVKRDAHMVPAE